MRISLTNYRCFPGPDPVTLDLSNFFTALVGANNSGKSSLIRFLYEFRPMLERLTQYGDANTHALYQGQPVRTEANVGDPAELLSNANRGDLVADFFFPPSKTPSPLNIPQPNQVTFTVTRADRRVTLRLTNDGVAVKILKNAGVQRIQERWCLVHGDPVVDLTLIGEYSRALANSLYIGAFRNAINVGGDKDYFDIPVGEAFVKQWNQWKAGTVKAHRDDATRLVTDIRDLFRYDSLEVNPASDGRTLMLTVDGATHWLSEIGSGIAQFVIVLGTAAIKKPDFILIDEPELNLHPSLQRDFLIALALRAKRGVVFATHSLGLAHCDAERVYSVRRLSQGRSELREYGQTPRLPEFLGEMGYSGYKERNFDTVLLVEGVYDVKVARHYLGLYGKDQKVVIVQLGGTSMIHGDREFELREVLNICDRVFAVVDSERTAAGAPVKKEVQEFAVCCAKVGITCKVLDRRATENYFTPAAIAEELGSSVPTFGPYDLPPSGWEKKDNWKIALHMNTADLDATDLGPFFATL